MPVSSITSAPARSHASLDALLLSVGIQKTFGEIELDFNDLFPHLRQLRTGVMASTAQPAHKLICFTPGESGDDESRQQTTSLFRDSQQHER